jgi:hypothetical protein
VVVVVVVVVALALMVEQQQYLLGSNRLAHKHFVCSALMKASTLRFGLDVIHYSNS